MKTWGSEGIAPHINVSTRGSFKTWPLYSQGKNPLYSLYRRLSGIQSWLGHGGKVSVKLSLCLTKYHIMKTFPVFN